MEYGCRIATPASLIRRKNSLAVGSWLVAHPPSHGVAAVPASFAQKPGHATAGGAPAVPEGSQNPGHSVGHEHPAKSLQMPHPGRYLHLLAPLHPHPLRMRAAVTTKAVRIGATLPFVAAQ